MIVETEKISILKKPKEFNNYKIQLEAIVDYSMPELKTKFVSSDKSEYKIILRTFVPIFNIVSIKKSIKRNLRNEYQIIEDYAIDSPYELSTYFKNRGINFNTEEELRFFIALKKIPLIEELYEFDTKEEDRISKLSTTLSNGNTKKFFDYICEKHHGLSKNSDYLDLFTRVLMMEEIKLERNQEIKEFMYQEHKHKLEFRSELSADLYSIVEWKKYNEKEWNMRFDEKAREYGIPLEGIEKTIIAEIVPKNLGNYFGEIGGKTVKIANYNDLNTEFLRAVAFSMDKATLLDFELHKKLREEFIKVLIGRRYVFDEAVGYVTKGVKQDVLDYNLKKRLYRLFLEGVVSELNKKYELFNN